MAANIEIWRPGSFTKNFSWGPRTDGLIQLHREIRLGFHERNEDVLRNEFRRGIRQSGRPDYIPVNFFLFNLQKDGKDFIVYDELVFQAQNYSHSSDFDRLALFAFNLSLVGAWRNAEPGQERPALWANAYVREQVAGQHQWDASKISADDIESFVRSDPRYKARTSRKLATNLNYLYMIGGLSNFKSSKVSRWWVNALFLALDRLTLDRARQGRTTSAEQLAPLLAAGGFINLTGPKAIEKDLAVRHLVKLYNFCGGIERFSEEAVKDRTRIQLQQIQNYIELRPGAAIHSTNPNILKAIPAACAMLARHAGFDFIDADELEKFDVERFVRSKAASAISRLEELGIAPTMTAAQLMKITREK